MLAAATVAAAFGFFTLPPVRDDPDAKKVPITILPRTGGGMWIVTPASGSHAATLPGRFRKVRLGPPPLRGVVAAMKGKIAFRASGQGTAGSLILEDGVLARVELGAGKCTTGAVVLDPSTAPKTDGGLTRADFLLIETDPPFACDAPPPDTWQGHGLHGGLRITFDGAGRPVGVQLVGYMFSMVFVREGESRPEVVRRLVRENQDEVMRQAE
jgi:hypothetical protein